MPYHLVRINEEEIKQKYKLKVYRVAYVMIAPVFYNMVPMPPTGYSPMDVRISFFSPLCVLLHANLTRDRLYYIPKEKKKKKK